LEQQQAALGRIQSEMATFRKLYTTMKPREQAMQLGIEGMRLLKTRDGKEAIRAFQAAHGFDRTDPGHLYGLALAYRMESKLEIAELMAASGIAAERYRALDVWYTLTVERIQGAERRWLEEHRYDPVYGAYVPGVIHAGR
jgi:hypothetical protein